METEPDESSLIKDDAPQMKNGRIVETRLGEKPLIALVVILSMFGPISTDMFLPALGSMRDFFGTTEAIMNMALYVFVFFLAVSILILGTIGDKYGRRKVLVASLAVYTVMSLACCVTDNIALFIASRAIQAIGAGGALASAMAIVKDCFAGERMKQVLNIMVILGVLGPIVAPVLGGILVKTINWQSTFWVPAIISGICLVMALFLPKEIPLDRYTGTVYQSLGNLTKMLKNKSFTIFMFMICMWSAVQLAYVSVSSYIYRNQFGLDEIGYSLVMASGPVIAIIGDFLIRRYIQPKIGNKGMVLLLPIVSALSMILVPTLGRTGWLGLAVAIIPCCIVMILSRTFGFNILLREFDGDNGAISSLINFLIYLFCCFGMVMAVLPWPDFTFAVTAVSAFCCVLYVIMMVLFKAKHCKLRAM